LLVGIVPLVVWAIAGVRGDERTGAVVGSAGPPASTPAPVSVAATAPSTTLTTHPPQGPCQDALAAVAAAGLPLPPGAGYHCPSTQWAHHGTTCWYASQCPRTRFIAINTELMGPVTTAYFRYVVAHEVCHVLQFDAKGESSEAEADACAAAHGYPPVSMRPSP
jgi:hypothetical protein